MKDLAFFLPGRSEKAVVLVHGLTGAPAEMRFLAKRLNAAGLSVLVPQLAGHGTERDRLLKTTWRDWYASVERAFETLRPTATEIYIAGICVGGALGLKLAAERPEIRGVAAYSMTFEYDGWAMKRWMAAAPVIQLVADLPGIRRVSFAEPYPFGLKDERLRRRVAEHGAADRLPFGALYQMYRLGRHVEQIGRGIATPVLILHARNDDMSSVANAFRLRRCLGGTAELCLLDDSFHMIHVDQERERVAQHTIRFFGGAAAAPGFPASTAVIHA
jgi:carboxylesterase